MCERAARAHECQLCAHTSDCASLPWRLTVKSRSHSEVCCNCRTMRPQLGSIRGMRSCAGSIFGTGTPSTGHAHAGDEHAACTWDGSGSTGDASGMSRARGGTGGGGVTGRGCSSLIAASIVGGSAGAAVAVAAGRGTWASLARGVLRMGRGAGEGVGVTAALLLPPGAAGCAGDAFARANSTLSSGCWNDTLDGVRGWRCVDPPVAVAAVPAPVDTDAADADCAVNASFAISSGGSCRACSVYNTSALMLDVQCDGRVRRHDGGGGEWSEVVRAAGCWLLAVDVSG